MERTLLSASECDKKTDDSDVEARFDLFENEENEPEKFLTTSFLSG